MTDIVRTNWNTASGTAPGAAPGAASGPFRATGIRPDTRQAVATIPKEPTDPTEPTEPTGMSTQTVPIASQLSPTRNERPPPSTNAPFATQVAYIKAARQRIIQWLAVQFKTGAEKKEQKQDLSRVPELEGFLDYLDTVRMTPALRAATFIDKGLDLVTDPKYCFPAYLVSAADALKEKWQAQNWGQEGVAEVGDGQAADIPLASAPAPAPTTTSLALRHGADRLPPPDHPIFGEHGIMHGIIMSKSSASNSEPHDGHRHRRARTVYRRHPFYPPRSAHVFGDNGLRPGNWWPLQIAALFHGAHGSSQGGISGSVRAGGAYSIVLSGGNANYHDLDDDLGAVVFYSGSRSHANRDPDNYATPPNHFTQALVKSLQTGKPVRVLRSARSSSASASASSPWAPPVGIRYDGLYRVVDMQPGTNEYGGLYERFELRRLPGQTPLDEVRRTSPTAQQRRDYLKIAEGY